MQTFYSQLLSSQDKTDGFFYGLLQITRSQLSDVLAVKSALAWSVWGEKFSISEA